MRLIVAKLLKHTPSLEITVMLNAMLSILMGPMQLKAALDASGRSTDHNL